VAVNDPLLEFESEFTAVPANPLLVRTAWPVARQPTYAIDTTSRVISFVLGFALASVIAWLGSFEGDQIAMTPVATPVTTPVASTVRPVVAATTTITKAPPNEPVATKAAVATKPAVATPPPPAVTRAVASSPAAATPVKPTRPAAPSGDRGTLALSSVPEGAQVMLNGTVVGQTPVVLNDLPAGSRVLLVRREGYSPWSASVRVVANQRTTVRATLTPAPRTGG
jgi:hypothetical protein